MGREAALAKVAENIHPGELVAAPCSFHGQYGNPSRPDRYPARAGATKSCHCNIKLASGTKKAAQKAAFCFLPCLVYGPRHLLRIRRYMRNAVRPIPGDDLHDRAPHDRPVRLPRHLLRLLRRSDAKADCAGNVRNLLTREIISPSAAIAVRTPVTPSDDTQYRNPSASRAMVLIRSFEWERSAKQDPLHIPCNTAVAPFFFKRQIWYDQRIHAKLRAPLHEPFAPIAIDRVNIGHESQRHACLFARTANHCEYPVCRCSRSSARSSAV